MAARQALERDDYAAEPRSLDLRDYSSIVRRRWRLVLVMVVVGALGGGAYAVVRGPSYTATAQVVVAAVTQGPLNQATQASSQVNMSTEQAIAQSAPVIQQAAATLGVPVAHLVTAVSKRLSVTVPASVLTTSNVLQISWQASTPSAAQQGADAFANAYLSYRHHQLAGQVAVLEATLQQQADSLKGQMSTLSEQLSRTSAASVRQILGIRLNELSGQASTAETQLATLPTYNVSGGNYIPAVLPGKPSGVGRSVIIAIGLILGLLIGLALAFTRDIFDDRLLDATQFEERLGAAKLAVLSPGGTVSKSRHNRSSAKSASPPAIAMVASPESWAADAARALRATVVAVSARRKLRVLLVVAADGSVSSGRVVAELGIALAESGRRVLLVASDLRSSILPQVFGIANSVGLSELLIQGGDAEVLTRRPRQASGTDLPAEVAERLTLLPSGQRTIHALSILDSSRMLELLGGQRESHDFVLLDAPPATAVDIVSLAAHVDGVIVLARESHTKGKDVEALRVRLDQLGAPIVGGVLIGKEHRRGRRLAARPSQPTTRSAADVAWAPTVRSVPAVTRHMPSVPGDSAPSSTTLKQPR